MFKTIFLVVIALALARAQMPNLGRCPEYVPMANFDISKFLGTWYEAERSFQITEVASRCAFSNYTKGPDNKLRVSNTALLRLTGFKRVLEGEIKPPASKAEEGKLHVKYTTVPLNPETSYAVLETDYKSYAVMWNCYPLGLFNAQNAWIMTRNSRPTKETLQAAYGVLDKYKIPKSLFVKTDQNDCLYYDEIKPVESPAEKPAIEVPAPVVVEEPEENQVRIVPGFLDKDKEETNNTDNNKEETVRTVETVKPELLTEDVKADEKEEEPAKLPENSKLKQKIIDVAIEHPEPLVVKNPDQISEKSQKENTR